MADVSVFAQAIALKLIGKISRVGELDDGIRAISAPVGNDICSNSHGLLEGGGPHNAPDGEATNNVGDVNESISDFELGRVFQQDCRVKALVRHKHAPQSATTERLESAVENLNKTFLEVVP